VRAMEENQQGKRPGSHGGVVFTPEGLARRLAEPFSAPMACGGPALLDPACGDGALLLAALELRGGGAEEARGLYGIEINPQRRLLALERLASAAKLDPRELAENIICADALSPLTPWKSESAVIANPPWLSFSGRHRSRSEENLARRGPGGWPSLQGAFLQRIAAHCAEERLSARLLMPGSILELERYGPLREAISKFVHQSCEPEELGEKAFPGILEPSIILSLSPGSGQLLGPGTHPKSDLLRHLERFKKLPPGTFGDPGVHTGNSSKLLVQEQARGNCASLRRGADLAAYDLAPAKLHLRLDLERDAEHRFRISALEKYQSFPVLLRQTADRPLAALHKRPGYFRNSLLAARHVPGLEPEFLVALLNSPVATAWHRSMFRDARQRSFPQVKVGHLRSQPTPIEVRQDDPGLHDEVVARVRALDAGQERFSADCLEIGLIIARAFGLEPDAFSE
jgi:hypothetical protein